MSQTTIFRDMFGKDIKVGDWVVMSNSGRGGTLYICRVAGFKKARMYITRVYENWREVNTYTERFNECVIVPEDTVPLNWVLKAEPTYQEYARKFV